MIDIHSHILPGVDDGAKNMEQTKRMLKIAYSEGIRSIIATPHYRSGGENKDFAYLDEMKQKVQEEALLIDSNFKIYLGNELYYSEGIIEDLQAERALTLDGTRFVLVEFLPCCEYRQIQSAIHNFLLSGYVPIIAHAERYLCLVQDYRRIQELIQAGAYIQMNISGLIGGITNKQSNFCKKLIKKELVHFIGTDAHSDNHRAPYAEKGLKVMSKKWGIEVANTIAYENPTLLLENKYL
jgi:protein-tyrosine phosphatase